MEATTTTTNQANPACTVCHGSGQDDVFGTDCTECWVDARRNEMIAANYAGVATTQADRMHTPGERLDGRTWGNGSTAERTPGGATVKAANFLRKLLAERGQAGQDALATIAAEADIDALTAKQVSGAIDALKALKNWEAKNTPAAPADRGNRTNRYPGNCVDCGANVPAEAGLLFKVDGKWATAHHPGQCPEATSTEAPATEGLDLTSMVSGRYAVPGGDTRLKLQIDVVTKGKWEGWVFVKDAAEYGSGTRYGKQRPGSRYTGKVEAELATILADPKAAAVAYGQLTGKCCVCNRTLEDENSVAAGIGPVCAQKF